MATSHEIRRYEKGERIWVGKYKGLQNLPHWHYDCELIFVNDGNAEISVNNTKYSASVGDALFVGSGEMHYIKSATNAVLTVILFDAELVREIIAEKELKSALLFDGSAVELAASEIKAELEGKQSCYATATECLLKKLVIDVFRGEATREKPKTDAHNVIPTFKNLADDVNEKYAYYTFSMAASFSGLSQAYFSKQFKSVFGMTFSQFLNAVRVEKAISFIESDRRRPLTDVAISCGFNTIRNFNRVFKALTGMNPKSIPDNYALPSRPLYATADAFNPTLESSRLLEE